MWVNIDKTNINSYINPLQSFLYVNQRKLKVIQHKLKGHIFLILLIKKKSR